MKFKRIILIAATLSLGVSIPFTALAVSNGSDENKKAVTREANKISIMTDAEEVQAEGNRMFGSYVRKLAELKGEIQADSPRLTLEELEGIIAENSDYQYIVNKLNGLYPYPDYIGGSGVTITEYWLDNNGDNRIKIISEEKNIVHIVDSSDNEKDTYDILINEKGV